LLSRGDGGREGGREYLCEVPVSYLHAGHEREREEGKEGRLSVAFDPLHKWVNNTMYRQAMRLREKRRREGGERGKTQY